MRIAYLITRSDAIGGAHIHVRDLSHRMMQRGHDVTVMVGGEGPFTEQLADRGVPYISIASMVRAIQPRKDLAAVFELTRRLRAFAPNLISTHSAKAGWIGRSIGRVLGVPTLFTAHGWSFTEGRPPMQRRFYIGLERLTARLATKIITVSDYDRRLALTHRIASAAKIVCVHNGVHDVDAALRAAPRADGAPTRFVTVARFEEPKDHLSLIRALSTLPRGSWTLTILGEGPLMPQSRALAAELGVTEAIAFLGLRKDVPEQLAAADVFVLVSNWEGFPRSILEAMRAGLPVVSSDVGGVSESVEDGVTGFLVPRGDVAKLGARLAQLNHSFALRREMGERGRQRYEERFTFEGMLENTLGVYASALAGSA